MSGSDEKSPELPLQDAADVAADAGASQASGADTAAGASQVSETSTDSSLSQPPDSESRLDVARRFLEDESVRDSPREKKVEFLRSKDLTDEEIEQLLGQEPQPSPEPPQEPQDEPQYQERQAEPQYQEPSDRPPIITYPEFLAKPANPPLLSPTTLLNALCALTGVATLLHGTKRYYIDPSLDSQTTARHDLSTTTSSHLTSLLSKLESTVSTIPVTTTPHDDDASSCEDPTELFSRDVGTQTSPPTTPLLRKHEQPPVTSQAGKLAALSRNLSDLKEGLDAQAENTQEAMVAVDAIRENLREASVARSYANLGWSQPEPDDEVKKVKESIRRLKGVFLSTRNFPVSAK